jgi:hypothetical protein
MFTIRVTNHRMRRRGFASRRKTEQLDRWDSRADARHPRLKIKRSWSECHAGFADSARPLSASSFPTFGRCDQPRLSGPYELVTGGRLIPMRGARRVGNHAATTVRSTCTSSGARQIDRHMVPKRVLRVTFDGSAKHPSHKANTSEQLRFVGGHTWPRDTTPWVGVRWRLCCALKFSAECVRYFTFEAFSFDVGKRDTMRGCAVPQR